MASRQKFRFVPMFHRTNAGPGPVEESTVAGEETPFGQIHELDFHGDGGTLHAHVDWDRAQNIRGARRGEGAPQPLPIPEEIWQGVRRDTVHNTYRDVFRTQETMARQWVSAIAQGQPVRIDWRIRPWTTPRNPAKAGPQRATTERRIAEFETLKCKASTRSAGRTWPRRRP